jgi:hypothetical protein
MMVCRDHLHRELAKGHGAFTRLPPVPREIQRERYCEVGACPALAEFDWMAEINQDEIPTLRVEKDRDPSGS